MKRNLGEVRNGVDSFPEPDESDTVNVGPSLTRQSEAASCDINLIMAQFESRGTMPVNQMQALFDDVSEVGDYRDLLERLRGAEEAFMSLPAKVRSRFGNDPGYFIDYLSEPGHEAELRDLGLLEPPAAPPPASTTP